MKWLLRIVGIILALLVIAFLFLRTPDTDPAEMRAKYGGEPSQFVEMADGLTVHLRDEGPRDAPVIMLLHGSNADIHTWQPWAEALKQDYRVVRFDQIGHGLTGPAKDDNYALEAFVADINDVADALEIEKFVLAGNSMGGAISMGYALEHPERLNGLILVDAGGADIKREGGGNLLFTLAAMPGINKVMGQITPRSMVETSLSQSVFNQDIVTDEAIDRYWELGRYPGNRQATLKRFSTPRQAFDEDKIRATTVPTLVMWGEEDSLIPYEAAGWYMDRLPNATLANYGEIGHMPMEEAPVRSAMDVRNFMENLTATTEVGAE
ncbi:alpha/beta hydrolase [Pontixanthobacter sp. CEM42]|uniref:alpha/beta fold hydrolase n=1 Tax=Pontixanthobacter sp. CEM42 TaxID=2792077 RepID=UPI001ADFEA9D|nr:alpha/beta hydrolase [Pontixanthobacter sp. CEM42]